LCTKAFPIETSRSTEFAPRAARAALRCRLDEQNSGQGRQPVAVRPRSSAVMAVLAHDGIGVQPPFELAPYV